MPRTFCLAYDLKAIALRYFNPIGADPKMRTGLQIASPTHILGSLVEVALGRKPMFQITGVDWATRDGTGIRDYIHVWDLAQAHVKAVTGFTEAISSPDADNGSYLVINLGTSKGVTVREFVEAFEKVNGGPINKEDKPARPGDVAGSYANADRAKRLLGWETKLTIEDAISDAGRPDNRRRLGDPRRHRHPRLYPRLGSRTGPRKGRNRLYGSHKQPRR